MWFTKKNENKVMEADNNVNESVKQDETKTEPVKPVEEWIWVEGYKATDKDMKCRDYQYTLGEQHDMPEDAKIEECESGFHLCKNLNDVFGYYEIGNGNRYFKVRALVRKDHYERYGEYVMDYDNYKHYVPTFARRYYDRMVARSIVFERELTRDEILEDRLDIKEWSEEYKELAINTSISIASNKMRIDDLTSLGYSETFAKLIIDGRRYDIAKSVGSQPDLSMDMKYWLIFK